LGVGQQAFEGGFQDGKTGFFWVVKYGFQGGKIGISGKSKWV